MSSAAAQTFAVLGATGQVGGRAARQLLAAGHHVRALVRDTTSPASAELKKLGAELHEVKANSEAGPFATNEAQLISGFSGVDGAFVLIPPHLTTADPNADAFGYLKVVKHAIVASKVPKVVLLSSIAAHLPSGTGVIEKLHHLEQEFNEVAKTSQIAVVYVRAGYFMSNLLGSLAAVPHGILPGAILKPDVKVNFISTDDIGDQVAKSLSEEKTERGTSRFVELAGPEDVSHAQVAAIISSIVGKDIAYSPIPQPDQQKTFEGFGLSPAGAAQFLALAAGIDNGTISFEHPSQIVRGKVQIKDFLTAVLKK